MAKRELTARYLFFIAGLFVNAFGISLIIKANLGSSPISSLPYTLSLKFPIFLEKHHNAVVPVRSFHR